LADLSARAYPRAVLRLRAKQNGLTEQQVAARIVRSVRVQPKSSAQRRAIIARPTFMLSWPAMAPQKKQHSQGKRAPRREPPIPVRAVDFVVYCTRDMRRTRAFYQKLFGLRRGEEWNNFWSEFDTSPVTLCLNGPGKQPIWDWQGTAAVALAVKNIH